MQVSIDGIIYSLQGGGGISVYFSELIRYLLRQPGVAVGVDLFEPLKGQGIDDIVSRSARPLSRYRVLSATERTALANRVRM